MSELDAYLLSLCIEMPIALAIARRMNLKDLRRVAIVALLATSLTHPFVWVLATGWTRIFAAEIGAALVESICYVIAAGASVRVGLTIGVTTNVASACFGFVLLLALKHHP